MSGETPLLLRVFYKKVGIKLEMIRWDKEGLII